MSELPADVVVVDGDQYPALEGELILAQREIERLRAELDWFKRAWAYVASSIDEGSDWDGQDIQDWLRDNPKPGAGT